MNSSRDDCSGLRDWSGAPSEIVAQTCRVKNVCYELHGPGSFRACKERVPVGDIRLKRMVAKELTLRFDLIQKRDQFRVTFFAPLPADHDLVYNSCSMREIGAAVLPPGCIVPVTVARGMDCAMIELDADLLSPWWQATACDRVYYLRRDNELVRCVWGLLMSHGAGGVDERGLLSLIAEHVRGAIDQRELFNSSLGNNRLAIATMDVLAASIDQPVTVDSIAESLAVSRRRMELAFRSAYGISVAAGHRQLRLAAVRSQILWGHVRFGNIADVAAAYGFHHGGNFSRYYRQTFGVPPREDLMMSAYD